MKRSLLNGWWLLGLAVVALLVSAFGVWVTSENPSTLKEFFLH